MAVSVVTGASLRGHQLGARFTVGRMQLRFGSHGSSGWHPVGLLGGGLLLNAAGVSPTFGFGVERAPRRDPRATVELTMGFFTVFGDATLGWSR